MLLHLPGVQRCSLQGCSLPACIHLLQEQLLASPRRAPLCADSHWSLCRGVGVLQHRGEQRGRGLEPSKSGHVFFVWTNSLFSENSLVGQPAPSVKPCQMWQRVSAKKRRKKRKNETAWKKSILRAAFSKQIFRVFLSELYFLLTFSWLITFKGLRYSGYLTPCLCLGSIFVPGQGPIGKALLDARLVTVTTWLHPTGTVHCFQSPGANGAAAAPAPKLKMETGSHSLQQGQVTVAKGAGVSGRA